MNDQQARRVQKLMKIDMRAEHPPDLIFKFVNDSITLDTKIQKLSDKEAIDVLISKEDFDAKSVGVMYHILTCGENQELFARMLRFINGAGVDYWHTMLCNMNMALFEIWPYTHWTCKEQLIRLIREGVRQNVKQIENVVMSAFRTTTSSSDFPTKTRILVNLVNIIREYEAWFRAQKSCSALVSTILTCVSHAIVASPAPLTKEDTFRDMMVNFLHMVIRTRKSDFQPVGREFLLVLIRLGKFPQIEEIWRDIAQNPNTYGVGSIDELLGKPNMLPQLRLSLELTRRIEFMVYHGRGNMLTYFSWLAHKFFRFNDGAGLRSECVRFLVNMPPEFAKNNQYAYENRIQLIHLLIATAQSGPDQQWLKLCLFFDWFGCDDRNPPNFINTEVPLHVIRHALFLQAPPPHLNSIIQGSHCSFFANSLFEYVCKSVDVVLPIAARTIRRNLTMAMRVCRERLHSNFSVTLEHNKIDRRVADLIKSVWPEFVRNQGPLAVPKLKKKSTDEKRSSQVPVPEPEEPIVVEKVVNRNIENNQKEKEEREREVELTSSIKLLKGEVKTKIENLKAQWTDFNDDADKCEAVESVLNWLLNTKENFDDAQQELAAQCLLGIIGSVVVEEKSLLPENEADLSEVFTHPIYSFLKMLCSPPNDDDDNSSDVLTNMMAAMREKDSSLTYVFLYFIKGTGSRPKDCIDSYREIARISEIGADEMLASDLQMCAVNDIRLFAYLIPFVFSQFENEVVQSAELLQTLCSNLDAVQLRAFMSYVIREEIKLFRKDTFSRMVLASVEWATTPQWIFWHLVHADGVPIEWFLTTIPKLDATKHDEAISNIILMMKRMDREPWSGLIRAVFNRVPSKDDSFATDALKVLIEDTEQCQKMGDIVGQIIKKLLANNDIIGLAVRLPKKGTPNKLTLQQVLEHLQWFSTTCVEKKQRATEAFMARHTLQDAFAAIKSNEKASILLKKYSNLFGAMDIIAHEAVGTSSRTLRGNRQGSGGDKQQSKRKASDADEEQNSKKRKSATPVVDLGDSDSD